MKNLGGRPLKWKNPKVLKKLVDEYFENNTINKTLSGLANYLNITRSTLYEYDKKDKFSDIIKTARSRIETIYEERLVYGDRPTGVIFALKNMGWKDRSDLTTDDKEIPAPIYGGKSTE